MSLGTFEFPRYRRIRLTLLILPNTFQNLPIPFSSLSLSPRLVRWPRLDPFSPRCASRSSPLFSQPGVDPKRSKGLGGCFVGREQKKR